MNTAPDPQIRKPEIQSCSAAWFCRAFRLDKLRGFSGGGVKDTSGDYIEGADVKLQNKLIGQEFLTSSGEEGQFRFTGLAIGEYVLVVNVQGFKRAEVPVKIGGQTDSLIHIPLRIATAAESVVVSANSLSAPGRTKH